MVESWRAKYLGDCSYRLRVWFLLRVSVEIFG